MMQVQHLVPTRETRRHERTLDCPCGPSQNATLERRRFARAAA